ncbi:hypothetical protein PMAYCL1PPCAC_17363, partial [Pristionchus mayeri]
RPRESREKRLCLVCGGETRVSHLGVDLCRACAVFHRRSLTRSFTYRSRTANCSTGCHCRKCRFVKIDRLLAVPALKSLSTVPARIVNEKATTSTIFLSHLHECYRVMCETRLLSELSARTPPPHPLEMNDRDFIPIPATPSALNNANIVFLSAILNFGERAFTEFSQFSKEEKWKIATNFFHRFRLFESGYRAEKKFPNDVMKSFGSYTMYVSEKVAETFYQDEFSNKMMAESLRNDLPANRERFRRLQLHNEEFIAVVALMFWNFEELEFTEDIMKIGRRNREKVLAELQFFYKHKKVLEDYSSRLGELLLFIDIYSQLSRKLNNKFEMLNTN